MKETSRDNFFREVTIRICGSLDIKVSLTRSFQYLQHYIPVDAMGLQLYKQGSGELRNIAKVSTSGVSVLDRTVPWPQGPSFFTGPSKIINDPKQDPVRYMIHRANPSNQSVLLLKLDMDKDTLGILSLRANEKAKYTQEHAKLLETLKEPFTIALSNALKHLQLINIKDKLLDDNQYLLGELRNTYSNKIIGEHSGLKIVMNMVQQVAPLNSPVLLIGETGVGKDVIANAIHYASTRKCGPFIKVNCGAIPDTLLDSELFGHEKGAYTGATSMKRGRFERSHEGTIFLDEVGELLPQAQVRMLRVLQEKEIERVGGTKPIPVDIRLITATNRNLEKMIQTNQFRQDLWFRLNVFPIIIPPLRERKEDIPEFVRYFMTKKSIEMKFESTPDLAQGAIDSLMDYHWPGNVRELENIVERALILGRGEPIKFSDFVMSRHAEGIPEHQQNAEESLNLDATMSAQIKKALRLSGGKVHGEDGAAARLGINPSTLRHRMRKLGILYGRQIRT